MGAKKSGRDALRNTIAKMANDNKYHEV